MASNYVREGRAVNVKFPAAATGLQPATYSVGDPVLWGKRPGMAKTDRTAASTNATIWFYGQYDNILVDAPTAKGVGRGEILYFVPTAVNGTHLTTDSSATNAVRWGYTEEGVAAGTTVRGTVTVGY